MWSPTLDREDPLEEEMATHSSTRAWRIPGMGELGSLPSMGSHGVGHDRSDLAAAAASWQGRRCKKCGFQPWIGKIPWRRKWQPTPVLMPGESHGQRSLAGCSPRGRRVGHD